MNFDKLAFMAGRIKRRFTRWHPQSRGIFFFTDAEPGFSLPFKLMFNLELSGNFTADSQTLKIMI